MIYAFVSDEAFANVGTKSVGSYESIMANELGMLDDNLLNYFVQHEIMLDPVGSTIATNRRTRLSVDDSNATTGNRPTGRIYLHFDYTKLDPLTDSVAPFKVEDNDTESDRTAKILRRAALFNIIETIYMARYGATAGAGPKSKEDLEAIMVAASATDTSAYYGYVAGSLQLSSTTTKSGYRYAWENNVGSHEAVSTERYFWDSFSFSFKVGVTSTGEDVVQMFKIWLSPDKFKSDYPYSTIMKVVYPCDPLWIYEPSDKGGEMQAVLSAAQYKDMSLSAEVKNNDHSGIATYTSRYVHSSVSSNARMSFVVMYKGAMPTSAAMRTAVSEALKKVTDSNGNVLDERVWRARLPDLFVDGGFYLFPCYFQQVQYPNNIKIERSLVNYRSLYDKVRQILPNMDAQAVFDYMEILQVPGHKLYLVALPLSDNDSDKKSVLTLHPTYQALDSIGEEYTYTVVTPGSEYVQGVSYFRRGVNIKDNPEPIYSYIKLSATECEPGGIVPSTPVIYRREVTASNYWNTMTYQTKEFAQLLSLCFTVCNADPTNEPANKNMFTEEAIDGKQYYSFVNNSIEYHMLSAVGGEGILTVIDSSEDCEHSDGYIH